MTDDRRRCENCKWWSEDPQISTDRIKKGECRLRPPVVIASRHATLTRFPVLRSDEWCGEFYEQWEIGKQRGER
jgi:hypothetical protein